MAGPDPVDGFLASLPPDTRVVSLRRFRRATVGSRLKEVAHDLVLSGEEGPGPDLRPRGLELRATGDRGLTLATLELFPLRGGDDEVLRRCVVAQRGAGWAVETWIRRAEGEIRLERLHALGPGPVPAVLPPLRVVERPEARGFELEVDHVPVPALWKRLVILAATVLFFGPLLCSVVFRQGREIWTELVLPALWPRRERWLLEVGAAEVHWRWQPGRGPVEEGRVPCEQVLALSLAADRWDTPAPPSALPLHQRLRLVTATGVHRLPNAPFPEATAYAAHRLHARFAAP